MLDADLRPSLLITDLAMPRMGGEQLLQEIRARGLEFPVLVVSGQSTSALLALGANAIVTKPFRVEVLRAEVRRLLGSDSSTIP